MRLVIANIKHHPVSISGDSSSAHHRAQARK